MKPLGKAKTGATHVVSGTIKAICPTDHKIVRANLCWVCEECNTIVGFPHVIPKRRAKK
jgi:hypothetical protein